jgi:hypothetical protein
LTIFYSLVEVQTIRTRNRLLAKTQQDLEEIRASDHVRDAPTHEGPNTRKQRIQEKKKTTSETQKSTKLKFIWHNHSCIDGI